MIILYIDLFGLASLWWRIFSGKKVCGVEADVDLDVETLLSSEIVSHGNPIQELGQTFKRSEFVGC